MESVKGRPESSSAVATKTQPARGHKKLPEYAIELDRLDKKHGGVTPRQLVDAASDPDSVFHGEFEWENGKAAQRWRCQQARHLIGWIRVEVRLVGRKGPREMAVAPRIVRAFPSVPGKNGRSYMARAKALKEPLYRAELLRHCLAELSRVLVRMADVPELKELRESIEESLAAFHAKKKRKTG